MSQNEGEILGQQSPVESVVEYVKSGGDPRSFQIVEHDGQITCLFDAGGNVTLNVVGVRVPESKDIKNFGNDLIEALKIAGYGEDAELVARNIYTPMAEMAGRAVKKQRSVTVLTKYFGGKSEVVGKESKGSLLSQAASVLHRSGMSLFSAEALRTSQEIVNEDFESLLLVAQARNDKAKASYLANQLAAVNETGGKFGVSSTWVEMYERDAKEKGWPSLQTAEGFITLLEQVYKPVAVAVLAMPQIVSELADIKVESELAQPKHDNELNLLQLSEILESARKTKKGNLEIAVINADALVAATKTQHAETFIEAARLDGHVDGARLGAIGTILGETSGNALASVSALVFRPIDAIKRWADAQEDKKMVTFVLGGFIVAIPVGLAAASAAPFILLPIAGGALRTMYKSFKS